MIVTRKLFNYLNKFKVGSKFEDRKFIYKVIESPKANLKRNSFIIVAKQLKPVPPIKFNNYNILVVIFNGTLKGNCKFGINI